MGMHDEYFKKMETQLKKWDADVDALNASGEKASVEARATYKEQVKALRTDRDAAYKKLREMRAAGEKAGLEMKVGMDVAWQAMKKGLEKAASNFKAS
jgi:uncharacterized FlgJ-related protein